MNDIDRKILELDKDDKNLKEWIDNGFKKDIPRIILSDIEPRCRICGKPISECDRG